MSEGIVIAVNDKPEQRDKLLRHLAPGIDCITQDNAQSKMDGVELDWETIGLAVESSRVPVVVVVLSSYWESPSEVAWLADSAHPCFPVVFVCDSHMTSGPPGQRAIAQLLRDAAARPLWWAALVSAQGLRLSYELMREELGNERLLDAPAVQEHYLGEAENWVRETVALAHQLHRHLSSPSDPPLPFHPQLTMEKAEIFSTISHALVNEGLPVRSDAATLGNADESADQGLLQEVWKEHFGQAGYLRTESTAHGEGKNLENAIDKLLAPLLSDPSELLTSTEVKSLRDAIARIGVTLKRIRATWVTPEVRGIGNIDGHALARDLDQICKDLDDMVVLVRSLHLTRSTTP